MSPPLPPELEELVRRAAALDGGASPSRARQLRWVGREMAAHAVAEPVAGEPGPTPWLEPARVVAYLRAADAGVLRSRGEVGRPSPDATRRVRRACVRMLARAAGVEDPVADGVPAPAPLPRVEAVPAAIALSHWAGRARPLRARPGEVRAAAMAALTHEAGLRSGELAALRPEDVDLAGRVLTYRPRPPASRTLPPPLTVPLSAPTTALVRRWLEVRAELVARTPRTRSLWVSLRANHDGDGVRRPPGLPLQPNGLRRAHARAVADANAQLAGSPGWSPLPRTPGLLRPPSAPG